jgi:hypothetical protein
MPHTTSKQFQRLCIGSHSSGSIAIVKNNLKEIEKIEILLSAAGAYLRANSDETKIAITSKLCVIIFH